MSTPDIWTRVSARVARGDADLAAQAFRSVGCVGVQIEDVRLEDRGEDAVFLETPEIVVTSYREGSHPELDVAVLAALEEYAIPAVLDLETIDVPDWSTSWRENFPVLKIGRWTIAPTWETVENDAWTIRLDPGLAFGTGQHPTTQMCLEILGERAAALQNVDLLDVGCGSGVLSVAASKLGARVTASDFDPHCTQAAQENALLNGVEFQIVEAAGLGWARESFDVVIANLMSDLLISLASELAGVTRSTLIVSGISAPRAVEVETALQNAGFRTLEKRERDGEQRSEILERWTAFVLERQETGNRKQETG